MTDQITLAGIEVFAYHGVLEREKQEGQLFVIDVVVELDVAEAATSDDLEATVDYGALAAFIHERVSQERWHLIETVAERVADLVLTDQKAEAVTVTVHKPQAPLEVPFRDVAVTVRRSR